MKNIKIPEIDLMDFLQKMEIPYNIKPTKNGDVIIIQKITSQHVYFLDGKKLKIITAKTKNGKWIDVSPQAYAKNNYYNQYIEYLNLVFPDEEFNHGGPQKGKKKDAKQIQNKEEL